MAASPGTEFDARIRVLQCPQCGAPLQPPHEGGDVRCAFCGTTSAFAARRSLVRVVVSGPEADAERARLIAQRPAPLPPDKSPFDLDAVPPDLANVLGPVSDDRALAHLQTAWVEIRASRSPEGGVPDEYRALWVLFQLATFYLGRQDRLHARALVETALELLPWPGAQQWLRAWLAIAAAKAQDWDAAQTWLSSCDPNAAEPRLKACYEAARARLCLERGDPTGCLAIIGAAPESAPSYLRAQGGADLMRVRAYELLEQPEVAESLVLGVIRDYGNNELEWLKLNGWALPAVAKAEAAIRNIKASRAAITPASPESRARAGRSSIAVAVLVTILAALVGFLVAVSGGQTRNVSPQVSVAVQAAQKSAPIATVGPPVLNVPASDRIATFPHAVDPIQALPAIRAAAGLDKAWSLGALTAAYVSPAGLVDLDPTDHNGSIDYDFEKPMDPSPNAQSAFGPENTLERRVTLDRLGLHADARDVKVERPHFFPRQAPHCTTKQVWRAAIAAGAQRSGAVAKVTFDGASSDDRQWQISIEGTRFSVSVNDHTCAAMSAQSF